MGLAGGGAACCLPLRSSLSPCVLMTAHVVVFSHSQHTHHTTPPHAPNSYYNAPDTVYYRAAKQLEAHLEGWLAAHVVAVDD